MSTDSHPAAGSPAWRSSRGLARDPWRVGGTPEIAEFPPVPGGARDVLHSLVRRPRLTPCVPGTSFVHVQLPQLRRSIPAGAGRRSPEARRGHRGSGPSPCPVALPEETASRIDLGRRDLSRRARGAPAPRVSGSGAGPHRSGQPGDRHGNSPIVAMAIHPKMATTSTQTPTVNFTSLLTSANLLQHRRKSSSARAAASEPSHRA